MPAVDVDRGTRNFSKLHRFREHAINTPTKEDRRDRRNVRCDLFQSFKTTLATLKGIATFREEAAGSLHILGRAAATGNADRN
jgi:hypothetical protein